MPLTTVCIGETGRAPTSAVGRNGIECGRYAATREASGVQIPIAHNTFPAVEGVTQPVPRALRLPPNSFAFVCLLLPSEGHGVFR